MTRELRGESGTVRSLSAPRFRVMVFEGPANAVAVVDVTDATIEEALEAAKSLSNGNERLWSLALVDDDCRDGRGLIWLSGMDYNSRPTTATEWKLRGQMQDRYLMQKTLRGDPPRLPDGLRVIRFLPEWVSGWPLWENFTDAYRLDRDSLRLTPELGRDLFDWNEHWLTRHEDEPLQDLDGWQARGIALLRRLRSELDGIAEVRPEFLGENLLE